jgi:hypothetical protein
MAGEPVLPGSAAAQPDHVPRAVIARDPRPAGVGLPLLLQLRRLLADRVHVDHASLVTAAVLPYWPCIPSCGAAARIPSSLLVNNFHFCQIHEQLTFFLRQIRRKLV